MRGDPRARKFAIFLVALLVDLAPALLAQDDDATLVDDRGARTSATQRARPLDRGYGVIDDRDRQGVIDDRKILSDERHALAV